MPLNKDDHVRQTKIDLDPITFSIFVVCLDLKHNFHLTDHEGKNFLHYAAKSGNYNGFIYTIKLLSEEDIGLLLKKKDKMDRTPLHEVIYSKHESFEVLRIPFDCEIKDVFSTFCGAKL
jgi:ankyrin repeat protein